MAMDVAAFRRAPSFALNAKTVSDCLDERCLKDQLFARAWRESLHALTPGERRGALAGVTGHVAESVTEVLFEARCYYPVWHFTGAGGHGVDLLMLCPALERIVAIEVKGTLRLGHWPRFRRGEITQMSLDWMNKSDNPGMAEWELEGRDVYGAAVLINFADMRYRLGLTCDFSELHPLTSLDELSDLAWLDRRG